MGDNGELHNKETVNVEDLVLAVKRGENGIETLVNSNNRAELEVALMRLTHQVFGVFNAMSHAAQEASKSKIVKPGGIMNFARRKK